MGRIEKPYSIDTTDLDSNAKFSVSTLIESGYFLSLSQEANNDLICCGFR